MLVYSKKAEFYPTQAMHQMVPIKSVLIIIVTVSVFQCLMHLQNTYDEWKEMFLFNDALNTFYLRLYGIGYIVNNHSDSERGNLLLFLISSNGSLNAPSL